VRSLETFVRGVDALNEWLGRTIAWFTLGTVLICFVVVVLRYVFLTGVIWLQEAYVWLHAIVFMVGAGYTFKHGGHVKVDIFYGQLSARRKAWVDIFGTIVFLGPFLYVVARYSYQFIASAWQIGEISGQPGGFQQLYLLKTVIWIFVLVVGLQGLALIARRVLFLSGVEAHSPANEEA
jgi:TRAP-type mannitol/chloroaromatic compound transport system permease small subunit